MRSHRLDYLDGDFQIILPPPLLSKDGQMLPHLIRAYHLELHTATQGLTVWDENEVKLEQYAIALYANFGIYYNKIGQLLGIDTSRLTPLSRHRFFICTEPVVHPQTQQPVPGLCGLDQLMGYAYTEGGSFEEPAHTTGDVGLDILADSLLIFKRQALPLAQLLGTEDLGLINRRASERMKPPDEKTPLEPVEDDAPEEEDEMFVRYKEAIAQKLEEMRVPMPAGF